MSTLLKSITRSHNPSTQCLGISFPRKGREDVRKPATYKYQLFSCYLTECSRQLLTLAKILIDFSSIKSYRILRKDRVKRVFKLMQEYHARRVQALIALMDKELKLVVDGTVWELAKLNRARTQKVFWQSLLGKEKKEGL